MTTINPFRCKADEHGAEYITLCRNGSEYRVLALTKADAEIALDEHLSDDAPDIAGELPSLFQQ